jgi:hypothetical protein
MTIENDAQSGSNTLKCQRSPSLNNIECHGNSLGLPSFYIQLPLGNKNTSPTKLHGLNIADDQLWKAKGERNIPLGQSREIMIQSECI